MRENGASASSATCRSSWPRTAPTAGPTRSTFTWTAKGIRRKSPVCRRTISANGGRSGAIPSTAGMSWPVTAGSGGWSASAPWQSWPIWCGWTISAGSPRPGRSTPCRRTRARAIGRQAPAKPCLRLCAAPSRSCSSWPRIWASSRTMSSPSGTRSICRACGSCSSIW